MVFKCTVGFVRFAVNSTVDYEIDSASSSSMSSGSILHVAWATLVSLENYSAQSSNPLHQGQFGGDNGAVRSNQWRWQR